MELRWLEIQEQSSQAAKWSSQLSTVLFKGSQHEAKEIAHVIKVKRVDKVGHMLSSPWRHFFFLDIAVAEFPEPCLYLCQSEFGTGSRTYSGCPTNEHDLTSMIDVLREDLLATGPRRHNVHGNSES